MKVSLHHQLVDSIDARCSRTTGRQRDARRFGEPSSVGNQSQESIELTFFVLRRPRRQLALHFTDYQRSSRTCRRTNQRTESAAKWLTSLTSSRSSMSTE